MLLIDHCRREAPMALRFAAVGCLGFAIDLVVLKLCLALGLSAATARFISLLLAMQVTFTVNGLFVFRCLEMSRLPRQWLGYMGSNGFGNLCNYLIFVALVSSRLPVVSDKLIALTTGALTAWAINYLGARMIAFGGSDLRRQVCADCDAPAEPDASAVPALRSVD